MIYQGKARYPVREAVLHCAAIRTGQFDAMRPFQVFSIVNRWHVERGWKGFGYHGLIMPKGEYYPGRPFDMIGAHVKGHNRGTLGFLLIESRKVERIGDFTDWFTPPQRETLLDTLASVDGIERVTGHNDHAPKLCPGFKVQSADWL